MVKRVVLAGGSGFLGRALSAALVAEGTEVVTLTRAPRSGTHLLWDGEHVGAWTEALDGADAVVNLTGRSVDCRHTEANRREIIDSRVNSVRVIGEAIARCSVPPACWVQAASLAIYGDAGDRICDEGAPYGSGFSAEVCKEWEAALEQQAVPGTRKCVLRIGLALSREGGFLGRLVPLARWGLGGTVGSGQQYVSWVHLEDLNQMFRLAMERPEAAGVYNATGPEPVTNREFMRSLRRAMGRPWSPPAPAWAVRIGAALMGTDASLALTGRRCVPRRLLDEGFVFRYTGLDESLRELR